MGPDPLSAQRIQPGAAGLQVPERALHAFQPKTAEIAAGKYLSVAPVLSMTSRTRGLMCPAIFNHDHVIAAQRWTQTLLQIGKKHFSGHDSLKAIGAVIFLRFSFTA